MRIEFLFFVCLILITVSCANIGRITQIMHPEELNKENLRNMSYESTPEYGFRVGIAGNLAADRIAILDNVDQQFYQFSSCFNITDGGEKAGRYPIAVVNGTFACEDHGGRCNGQYDPGNSLVIVSYKAFSRKGILPLLKHEWAHAYGILENGHRNLKTVRKCTGY